jgi:hypothetical protein
VNDVVIFNQLFELSDGKIDLRNSKEELQDSSLLLRDRKKYSGKKSYKKSNKPRKRY